MKAQKPNISNKEPLSSCDSVVQALRDIRLILLEYYTKSGTPTRFVELKDITDFCRFLERSFRNRGITDTVALIKQARVMVLRSLSATPYRSSKQLKRDFGPVPRPTGLDCRGLPTILPIRLRRNVKDGKFTAIKWCLTLLFITRALPLPHYTREDSFESIIHPSEYKEDKELLSFVQNYISSKG